MPLAQLRVIDVFELRRQRVEIVTHRRNKRAEQRFHRGFAAPHLDHVQGIEPLEAARVRGFIGARRIGGPRAEFRA